MVKPATQEPVKSPLYENIKINIEIYDKKNPYKRELEEPPIP